MSRRQTKGKPHTRVNDVVSLDQEFRAEQKTLEKKEVIQEGVESPLDDFESVEDRQIRRWSLPARYRETRARKIFLESYSRMC